MKGKLKQIYRWFKQLFKPMKIKSKKEILLKLTEVQTEFLNAVLKEGFVDSNTQIEQEGLEGLFEVPPEFLKSGAYKFSGTSYIVVLNPFVSEYCIVIETYRIKRKGKRLKEISLTGVILLDPELKTKTLKFSSNPQVVYPEFKNFLWDYIKEINSLTEAREKIKLAKLLGDEKESI